MTLPNQESISWDNPGSTKSVYKLVLLEMFFSNKLTSNLYTVLLVYKNGATNFTFEILKWTEANSKNNSAQPRVYKLR